MRKSLLALAAAAACAVAVAAPASAITRGGELDGDDHPMVALMVAIDADGGPLWRCSGTFIDEVTYVTAGHCVSDPAVRAEIWLATDVESGIPGNGYPFVGDVSGTAHPHPSYFDPAFFLHDLGVVKLDGGDTVAGPYGSLPSEGAVDALGNGRRKATVTAVGYGLQEIVEGPYLVGPDTPESPFDPKYKGERVRYQAELMVVNTQGVAGIGPFERGDDTTGSFLVSGDAKHGGTCFGDSGGPMFAGTGTTLVGVNSFGLNPNCAGVGGAYRIDEADDLDFITCVQTEADPATACYPESD